MSLISLMILTKLFSIVSQTFIILFLVRSERIYKYVAQRSIILLNTSENGTNSSKIINIFI